MAADAYVVTIEQARPAPAESWSVVVNYPGGGCAAQFAPTRDRARFVARELVAEHQAGTHHGR